MQHQQQPAPPTYESAISRDVWVLVAPHTLSSRTRISDLRSACLVSRRWHEIFSPYLWGDPASHFEEDVYYDEGEGGGREMDLCDAISRFRRNLKIARLSVRKQTHTLRLPPARSEIYGGPKQTWLRDLLEYLPNLQALVVSGLSFFDHGALMGLRGVGAGGAGGGVRLLCADRETNATSAGLVEGLGHFVKLVYLDLSYTASARDPGVLRALGGLGDLLVLKMRGVRMRDEGVEVLTGSIGVKVRVLDLRDNLVTDGGVRRLIGGSFLKAEEGGGFAEEELGGGEVSLGLEGVLGAEGLRSEDLDGNVVDMLRQPSAKQPAFEYLPHSGITHLFISGNRLSGEGVAGLLASKRLCVLDAGSVDVDEPMVRGSEPLTAEVSAARRVIPVLVTSAAKSLTYLRVTHSVITEDAPIMDVSDSTDDLGERFAATGLYERQKTPEPAQNSPTNTRDKIGQLVAKRPKTSAISLFQQSPKDRILRLHPSHIRNLTTLVLTDIPSSVPASSNIIPSLIRFISSCADESLLATIQSQSNYSLPPGRFRANAERRLAKSLFALRRIILEITPAAAAGAESKRKLNKLASGGWNSEYYNNPGFQKSSTGDQDGERLWAAAANDFSFFGGEGDEDDGEEDGVPLVSEEDAKQEEEYRWKKALQARNRSLEAETGPRVDVVSALAQFRREKRREFEELVGDAKRGTTVLGSGLPVAVEGHWEGEVKVVRN